MFNVKVHEKGNYNSFFKKIIFFLHVFLKISENRTIYEFRAYDSPMGTNSTAQRHGMGNIAYQI